MRVIEFVNVEVEIMLNAVLIVVCAVWPKDFDSCHPVVDFYDFSVHCQKKSRLAKNFSDEIRHWKGCAVRFNLKMK